MNEDFKREDERADLGIGPYEDTTDGGRPRAAAPTVLAAEPSEADPPRKTTSSEVSELSSQCVSTGEEARQYGACSEDRTPEIIGAEIRALTASMLSNVIEIGRRMCEVKELLPHGSFGDWIKTETGYSLSSANNFMRVYQEYGGQTSLFGSEANSQTLGKLSYSKALALLAVPAEERETFASEVDAEHLSTRELERAIRERDEARREAEYCRTKYKEVSVAFDQSQERLEQELKKELDFKAEIHGLQEQVAELEARPVDVAVAEPDHVEIERRAAEIAAAAESAAERHVKALEADKAAQAAEIDALKTKAKAAEDKLREKLKAAETALEAAEKRAAEGGGPYKEEAERLTAEAERLRKELAMSGEALVTFKLWFSQWQDAYLEMGEAMEKMTPEQQERCKAAIKAQAGRWSA